MFLQQRTDRISDLATAAVADRHVYEQAGIVGGGLPGVLEYLGHLGRQQVECAHWLDPPALSHELPDRVLDDLEQWFELLLRPCDEIVGGEQPQGNDLDARLLAPLKQLKDLVG